MILAGLLIAINPALAPIENPKPTELLYIQNNALVAQSSSWIPSFYALSSPYSDDTGKIDLSLVQEKYPELYRIIFCESSFRENVCSYKGCWAGMGLAQIIPSTKKYCEEKLGQIIDPFNPDDNLTCALWLYLNEGTKHWKSSETCWAY